MFASLWRYLSIALAVLAVAAVLAALSFRGSALSAGAARARAEAERDAARAQVAEMNQARTRDNAAADATDAARATVDAHVAQSNDRMTQIEVRYRDRIVEVPAACPAPDADLLRESAEQARRISAAEDRLRGTRPAAQAVAR